MKRGTPWVLFIGALVIVGVCVVVGGLAIGARIYHQQYEGRIYPGVRASGVDLGGLTKEQAVAALQESFPDAGSRLLTVREGERTWSRSWAEFGIRFDPQATVDLAFQVGRGAAPREQYVAQLRALLLGYRVAPVVVLPTPAEAHPALESLASEVAVPPKNAALVIDAEGVSVVEAEVGRVLDIEATLGAIPQLLTVDAEGITLGLLTRQVAPSIIHPGEAVAHAESLLAAPFQLLAEDPLTGLNASWNAPREVVADWLVAQTVEDEDGERIVITVKEDPVRSYLESLNAQIEKEIVIDVAPSLAAIQEAVEAGRDHAQAALLHPQRLYTVQPGDTLVSVAHQHGFPVWRLFEANPGIEPGSLHAGDQIVIPSIDVLFPLPLITERHIIVDLSDQHVYAYEGESLVYDFLCSTGIESSPTIPGTFQILSKEDNAYASSWDLWMPNFMGVYRAGPDFTNGFHALPILSNGARLWEGYLGRPVSYGCIVLGIEEAATLYQWAELGTLVRIQE